MRGATLTITGLGLPLLIMTALWAYVNSDSSSPRDRRVQPGTTAAQSSRREPASPLNQLESARQSTASRPAAPEATLLDVLDDYLGQWQQRFQQDPDVQVATAAALLKKGDYAAAGQAFDRLLVRSPDDPVLLTGKAMALSSRGLHDDAIVLLENVTRRDPKSANAAYNLAVALMRAGQRQAALAALERVLSLDASHVKAKFNYAAQLQAAGQFKQAHQVWRELTDDDAASTALSPGMLTDAWSHRGETALQLRQAAEAERCFMQVAEREPRNAAAWCNVGIARAEQVRRSDALTALSIARRIDPNLTPALNQTAYIQAANYRDTGNPDYGREVVDCCRRSLQINPNQPNISALLRAVRTFDPTAQPEASGSDASTSSRK